MQTNKSNRKFICMHVLVNFYIKAYSRLKLTFHSYHSILICRKCPGLYFCNIYLKHKYWSNNFLKLLRNTVWLIKIIDQHSAMIKKLLWILVICNLKKAVCKGVYRKKSRGGQDLREAQNFFLPPPRSS